MPKMSEQRARRWRETMEWADIGGARIKWADECGGESEGG
jgi:hypothetical protein